MCMDTLTSAHSEQGSPLEYFWIVQRYPSRDGREERYNGFIFLLLMHVHVCIIKIIIMLVAFRIPVTHIHKYAIQYISLFSCS